MISDTWEERLERGWRMELTRSCRKRRSIRSYQDRPIEADRVQRYRRRGSSPAPWTVRTMGVLGGWAGTFKPLRREPQRHGLSTRSSDDPTAVAVRRIGRLVPLDALSRAGADPVATRSPGKQAVKVSGSVITDVGSREHGDGQLLDRRRQALVQSAIKKGEIGIL